MDIRTATPAQIDTEICRLQVELAQGNNRAALVAKEIRRIEVDDLGYGARRLPALRDELVAWDAQEKKLYAELGPLNSEYARRGGWTRYYLVEGGHLHYDVSADRCSRIWSTSHYWLTEFSGQNSSGVIELAGDRVCTICFPDAPVAVQERPSRLLTKTEQEKAEAARQREEKRTQAAKARAAKAIVDPETGGPLVITVHGWNETIKTERAAATALVDQLQDQQYDYEHDSSRVQAIKKLLGALAVKRGTTVEEERTAAEKRLAARIKREG